MIVQEISQLNPVTQRAVIINHNTRAVTFLALLSALRHAQVPLLLVDCASTDGSMDFFTAKMHQYDFDLLQAPLHKHGLTLDRLFGQLNDEQVLLIDSDAEILNNNIISFVNKHIADPQVFAAGFLNGPGWLTGADFAGTSYANALYAERPFMPLVLWKVQQVKAALQAGYSFADRMVNNEFAQLPPMLTGIFKRLYAVLRREPSWYFRKRYYLSYPRMVYFDTGAMLYHYLRYDQMGFFVNLPEPCHGQYITHFWGATRNTINAADMHTGGHVRNKDISDVVAQRLLSIYGETA